MAIGVLGSFIPTNNGYQNKISHYQLDKQKDKVENITLELRNIWKKKKFVQNIDEMSYFIFWTIEFHWLFFKQRHTMTFWMILLFTNVLWQHIIIQRWNSPRRCFCYCGELQDARGPIPDVVSVVARSTGRSWNVSRRCFCCCRATKRSWAVPDYCFCCCRDHRTLLERSHTLLLLLEEP